MKKIPLNSYGVFTNSYLFRRSTDFEIKNVGGAISFFEKITPFNIYFKISR